MYSTLVDSGGRCSKCKHKVGRATTQTLLARRTDRIAWRILGASCSGQYHVRAKQAAGLTAAADWFCCASPHKFKVILPSNVTHHILSAYLALLHLRFCLASTTTQYLDPLRSIVQSYDTTPFPLPIMSFQDKAQHQISQIDKEVRWHVQALMAFTDDARTC